MPDPETARQLGYLTRAVEDQGKSIEKMLELLRAQHEEAAQGRAALLSRIENLADCDDAFADRVKRVEEDLAPLKMLARTAEGWRDKWRGILLALAIAIPLVSAIVTAIWDKIMAAIFGGAS